MKNVYILSLVLFLIIAISSLKVYSTDGASCCEYATLPERESWYASEDSPEENEIALSDIANHFPEDKISDSDKDGLVDIINKRLWNFHTNMTQKYGSYNSQLQDQLVDLVGFVTECLDTGQCNDINGKNVRIKEDHNMYYITGNDLINLILQEMKDLRISVDWSR